MDFFITLHSVLYFLEREGPKFFVSILTHLYSKKHKISNLYQQAVKVTTKKGTFVPYC